MEISTKHRGLIRLAPAMKYDGYVMRSRMSAAEATFPSSQTGKVQLLFSEADL